MALRYFYVCFILKLSLVAGHSVHYVLKGREAILSPPLSDQPDDILWKHNGDKVITFDSNQEMVFRPYEGRVTLTWDTAELAIRDVRYEDSGEYELEALIKEKSYQLQYLLKVLDKVAKPVISCEINDESSNKTSGPRATLQCSSESNTPEALTYKWNLDGKIQLDQALTIPLGDEYDKIEYSCTATNPLHAETSIFMAKDCYKERGSEPLNILVPIIIAALILFAFSLFLVIFRHQIKRACFKTRNDDLEKRMKEAVQNTEVDESRPLMAHDIHRQEAFPSKQRLPQNDNGNVTETPQKQGIAIDLEELKASGKVRKNLKKFEHGEHTELLPDTQTGEENNTDSDESTASQPASPSSMPNSGPSGLESKEQQKDPEGEQDVDLSEQKTEAAVDPSSVQSSQEESPKASEQTVQNTEADESRPLMAHDVHRQEAFPSKQRLPQNDNGNVTETPQKQGIKKDLEELKASGKVQKNCEKFEHGEHTELLPDTQTGEENNTDSDESTASQPASPSSMPNSGPSGLESKEQQKDPEGEQDVDLSEQKTEAAVDPSSVQSSQEESPKASEQTEADESRPLMAHDVHRQEAFPSKQRLPQNDNGNVTETPQKQEIKKDLEELKASAKVQKNCEKFKKGGHTELLPDTQTGEENNTDSDESTASQPASPSSMPNSGPSGLESKEQQKDPEGEQDVDLSEQKTEAAVDPSSVQSSQEESPKASEQTESQRQQDSQTGPCKPESKGQGESGGESKTETANEEPQRDKSDYEGVASERKEFVSQPTDKETDTTSEQPESVHPPQSSVSPESDHSPDPKPGEHQSKGPTDSKEESNTDATGGEEPKREHSDQEANGSEPGSLSQPAPQSSVPPESDQVPREIEGHEESNNLSVDKETPRDGHKEDEDSEGTVNTEISPADSEPPGSEKKADKSQPPTHEAASPLSEHTDKKESKDTDGELTEDANSDQVRTKTSLTKSLTHPATSKQMKQTSPERRSSPEVMNANE